VVLPNGKLLEGRALRFYKNAITSQLKDTLSYQHFWATIAPAVTGKSRLYLSLDGVYNQINLNTLLQPGGNFLVADKNLTLLSNTKDLLALKGRRIKRMSSSTATLFGFPTFFLGKQKGKELAPARERGEAMDIAADTDRTGISPLAGTQEEINKVETILKNGKLNTSSFMAEQATEAQLKKVNHPRVLHIATHGFFVDEKNNASQMNTGDDQNPLLRSGLLLTGASDFIQNQVQLDDENGILTAYEASNLNLDNTDLVVLSACETGRGEVQNGEGVYGLQRAFQTAGVQSIIMSLWKVDDIATQQLMISFYTNWMGGKSKAEALKTAQLELEKKYPHPYYWGAFVMLEN
jgi:CHAT domain-containing protein